MTHRIVVASLLFAASLLGPVHARSGADLRALVPNDLGIDAFRSDSSQAKGEKPARAEPPHRATAQMLTSVGIVALKRLAFHSPDPRIGYAYKSAEIEVIAGALVAVAEHEQAPEDVRQAILERVRAMGAHLPTMPMSQMKMEHVLDWHKKTQEEFQKLRAALR
jgi:hypothetical protein